MSNQNESATTKDESVSELEMVGALLFGSISDDTELVASSEVTTAARLESSGAAESGRFVNLGARIAPETTRQWESEPTPSLVLNSRDVAAISEILPEKKCPSPVRTVSGETLMSAPAETTASTASTETSAPLRAFTDESQESSRQETQVSAPAVSHVSRSSSHSRSQRLMISYGSALVTLTICMLAIGLQLFGEKETTSVKTVDSETAATPTQPLAAPVTMASVEEVPSSAFAPVEVSPTFEASNPAQTIAAATENNDTIPQFDPNLAGSMQEAPTHQAVGGSVSMDDAYPSFDPNLGATQSSVQNSVQSTMQSTVQSTVQSTAQNMSVNASLNMTPNTSASAPVSAPANNSGNWNAGAAMEEIPVFNSEISSFAVAQPAPMAPQVGMQPTLPTSVSAIPTTAQPTATAPRKLAPPSATHQQELPVSAPEEEAFPSFNPEMGVDSSLPVSYY